MSNELSRRKCPIWRLNNWNKTQSERPRELLWVPWKNLFSLVSSKSMCPKTKSQISSSRLQNYSTSWFHSLARSLMRKNNTLFGNAWKSENWEWVHLTKILSTVDLQTLLSLSYLHNQSFLCSWEINHSCLGRHLRQLSYKRVRIVLKTHLYTITSQGLQSYN